MNIKSLSKLQRYRVISAVQDNSWYATKWSSTIQAVLRVNIRYITITNQIRLVIRNAPKNISFRP